MRHSGTHLLVHVGCERDDWEASSPRPCRHLTLAERSSCLGPRFDGHVHVQHSQVERERRRRRLRVQRSHRFIQAQRRFSIADARRARLKAGKQCLQRRATVRHSDDVEAAQLQ